MKADDNRTHITTYSAWQALYRHTVRNVNTMRNFVVTSDEFNLDQIHTNFLVGRATPQAVNHWLPTTVARVWSDGQSGAGAGFLRVLRFPLPIFIPLNSPSSQSPGAGTTGQKWPTCRVDPVWSPYPPKTSSQMMIFWVHADGCPFTGRRWNIINATNARGKVVPVFN
jgi:hypothetical protein